MRNGLVIAILLLCISVNAQIKGVVKDSISGKPIGYVTISVENQKIGATSEENGEFSINISGKSHKLIFSALGYELKTVKISDVLEVKLKPAIFQLDEVVISKRLETRQKEIGKTQNQIHEAFENAPRIDIKFFPYLPAYKKTKFIKRVGFTTDSKIDDATFKIHIYSVDSNGFPGEELLDKNFIVSVDKGVLETKFNLTKFGLRMPEQGIFIAFERLLIAKNKVEKTKVDANTKQVQTQTTYYPFMLYDSVERDFQYTFTNGKWVKSIPEDAITSAKMTIYEPAITLILTN